MNWIIGPALMFTLAWLLLPDLHDYWTGLIIVGLARCIAMVLIWNELACGDPDAAAVLVGDQLRLPDHRVRRAGLALHAGPAPLARRSSTSAHFSIAAIAVSVLALLGIPLVAGYLTRKIGERTKARDWYESRFLPTIGPVALYGLLLTNRGDGGPAGPPSPANAGTSCGSRSRY